MDTHTEADGALLDLMAGGHDKKAPEACCSTGFAYTGAGARGRGLAPPDLAPVTMELRPSLEKELPGAVVRADSRALRFSSCAGTHCETNGVHHRCCADGGSWTCASSKEGVVEMLLDAAKGMAQAAAVVGTAAA